MQVIKTQWRPDIRHMVAVNRKGGSMNLDATEPPR
jgi:hypothetical protein